VIVRMEERGRLMRRTVDNPLDGAVVDELMRRAVEATTGTYPHPNPRVGAIVVSPQGSVRSVAAHRGPGQPHAERLAIRELVDTEGDTMVVTLEPCDHHGRTPPCTDAIIESGIARVIIGAADPDPRVRGGGIQRLREAGIEVLESGHTELVEANDPAYYHHRRTGRPFVTLKLAMTLDGQIAATDGTSRWITSREAREDAHRLRAENDAIAVGAGTIRADDPELTVRLDGYQGPQPTPVIFKGTQELPPHAQVVDRDHVVVQPDESGRVRIRPALDHLAGMGILSVLVEGGAELARSFIDAELVDELVVYLGAKLAGGTGHPAIAGTFPSIDCALPLTVEDVVRIGPDIKITSRIGGNA